MHASPSAAHDFDFLHGRWRVLHRRLKRRLAACTEWEEFSGDTLAWPLLGGHGIVDDNLLELPSGHYRAVTLRSFDAARGEWSIWWLDGRQPGVLDTPMRGRFVDGVGSFHAEDSFEGRPIRVRFLWSDIGADRCQWQQAFSEDGGATWETNWIMRFERVAD